MEREQFGKPIGQFQMNQDMIAQMADGDRSGAADGLQGGLAEGPGEPEQQPGGGHGEILGRRSWPTSAPSTPCGSSGAYGYSTEYPVARYYRDAPTYSMVEGSANICKFIVAQDQLGIRKANR